MYKARIFQRFAANDTIKKYDRGVNWKKELDVKRKAMENSVFASMALQLSREKRR